MPAPASTLLLDRPLSAEQAWQRTASAALRDTELGPVGLELEQHVIDIDEPGARPTWDRVRAAVAALGALPGGSCVSLEPGGQLELSGPPLPGAAAAVDAMRADDRLLRDHLRPHRLGLAALGSDPLRPPLRLNPAPRYSAMEEHWAARGTRLAGMQMMCASASLQLNLEAGPAGGWRDRVALAHRLGPVLVAASACSAVLAGRADGWRSQRQRVWGALDQLRCGPVLGAGDPVEEWADYALCAPVMLVRDGTAAAPVLTAVPFRTWADGEVLLGGRRPTAADLDYHLTTLFPPVRLRGFLELRYLDAVPARWWPALARVVTALLDDPVAADLAAEACEPVDGWWGTAAREGLGNPALARAAVRCFSAAAGAAASAEVDAYAELVAAGRSPGDLLQARVRSVGVASALLEECDGRV